MFVCILQAEKDELVATNQSMNEKLEEMQLQLNKVIEENVKLRGSVSCSPLAASPSSPSSLTPIIEPEVENEETNGGEEAVMQLYATVDYSKVMSVGHRGYLYCIFEIFCKIYFDRQTKRN